VRVIQALYRASAAGVKIDLAVRGVCCLRPGVPGVSDNIRVFSIVGRFLEHERLFVFGASGEEQMFLSSADWMPRNLHRRVEVMFPVETAALRDQLRREVIEPALADTGFAYEMGADGKYARRTPAEGQPPRGAQTEVLELTLGRSPEESLATPQPSTAPATAERGAHASRPDLSS
jgi:polyphosphate kinase